MNVHRIRPKQPRMEEWERTLLGYRTVAVFFKDGESVVFKNVDSESIEFHAPESMLSFVVAGGREVNVPAVRYWTEED